MAGSGARGGRFRTFQLLLLLLLPLAGCGDGGDGDGPTLTVFAAASLTPVLEALTEEYDAAHPGVDVRLSFGGSADLASQVREGAEADVFVSADSRTMDALVDDGLVDGEPVQLATNTLTIAVPPGNPAAVRGPEDLARPGLDLVLCAPEVPCGAAARELAGELSLDLEPVSEEQSVTDVVAKVRSGEADAGLVYVTDVQAAEGDIEGVAVPGADRVVNHYPAAALEGSDHPALARELLDLLLSDRGRDLLADAGFGLPAR
ncbi:molybdate ABC transporter substrate-binding protein [Nocardioides sp. SYSU DS0651]|uniref:molybdate ABC transporter substrate-binding protein n=1 Tax=Nocardioides sp. SYSU DS0651 TaxID=3415955 RepID=UPI003F4B3794